ncbi:DNA polymerase III subunit gamma and tau [Corynebacterium sp.]|uniref:DNA polymerase III subunit gamma and tau n=1 Tax=Corynebacterium sp. TaxID=1720 RepID=UPI0027B8EC40|nr:DNA polymerase III subunit gamma and tau [Corynebacterium sp.]
MALYRKYRPASFAEVIGQSQVTEPLSVALDAHRINHAYLFSGPRGCGKTSSARILARSLNCVEGPTSTPCGKCDSCRALAPGGPGNLDVTELDAASHNGVEDMRELRDRGHYAPAESRYRIFIIDEAHMISQQGFNALLKIVEEPPEHLIFIFATTEPEKVIGTIRSRTHNYPFRLLTPPDMKSLLQHVVEEENVQVEDAVYPLVMQAGGGSPRDTLSLLDQLLAGAKDGELTYQQAAPLLGVTDLALIDRVIGALANDEKGELFRIVHDVINAGHEPRRFVEDLLDRLRDLLIIQSVPEAFEEGLVSAPQDRVAVLQEQSGWFSPEALTHYADVVNERLPQMRGATSPQLLLEILCAHLLARPYAVGSVAGAAASAGSSPAAGVAGTGAPGAGRHEGTGALADDTNSVTPTGGRNDSAAGGPRGAAAALAAVAAMGTGQPQTKSTPSHGPAPAPAEPGETAIKQDQSEHAVSKQAESEAAEPSATAGSGAEPTESAGPTGEPEPTGEAGPTGPAEPTESAEETSDTDTSSASEPNQDVLETIRSRWTNIRSTVGEKNRVAEVMLTEAKVLTIDGDTVVLGHNTGALAERINSERNNAVIVEAVSATVGQKMQVRCVVGTKIPAAHNAPKPRQQHKTGQQLQRQAQEPQQRNAAANASVKPDSSSQDQDWREVAKQAKDRARRRAGQSGPDTFGDGVPLPPEPAADEGVPDEQASQSSRPPQSSQPRQSEQRPQTQATQQTEHQPDQQPGDQSGQQPGVQVPPASSSTSTAEVEKSDGGESTASSDNATDDTEERSPEEVHAAARRLLETELGARPL